MTYRGAIKNGVVVFDEPVPLEDGTVVEVEPLEQSVHQPEPGSPEAMRRLRSEVCWHGDPEELQRLQAEVQAMRESDIPSLNQPNPLDRE